MAKGRKRAERPKGDRHTSRFVVRLPKEYRALVEELAKKTDRTLTTCVRRGVDKELRENGIKPPAP